MRDRPTARVLLFDPDGRILLILGRMTPTRPARWFTPGGGMEPGETVLAAAVREIREETGLDCAEVGPLVWLREGVGLLHSGEEVLFKEHFVVATVASADLNRSGWEPHEVELMDDMRWWTLEELAASEQVIFPEGLHLLLSNIRAGDYPDPPLRLPPWNEI